MKKRIITLIMATGLILSITGCGGSGGSSSASSASSASSSESTTSASSASSSLSVTTDLSFSENVDVKASLAGTVRHFEPTLILPEDPDAYTIAKVNGHYNLVVTAQRPDGSNAMISYWVDLGDDDKYSVHYFSVKDDVYVDDGVIE